MKPNQIVTPSSQVDALLPQYVVENYSKFVGFMESAAQSEERIGFGQDILQNLLKYRNLDTYKNKIVQHVQLALAIDEDADELRLVDGYGFPEENGVLLIGDEVILYSERDGDICSGLLRGAAATVILPTFRSSGEYVKTTPGAHGRGARVTNISVLFLVAMLENIHGSFVPGIDSSRISDEINRSSLIQNIKDFYASKGSKLGIKALFKAIFGQDDVKVSYPGDRMVNPSTSSWAVNTIIRAIPWSPYLCDPNEKYTTPDKLIGSELLLKTFPAQDIISRAHCEYVSTYPLGSEMQYEISTNTDADFSDFILTNTVLARPLEELGVNNNEFDVYTMTVESTAGFPESGVVFVGTEGIAYKSKTQTQFLECTRGYVSVVRPHIIGEAVYGAYFLEGKYTDDNGETYVSRSWPTGVVSGVKIQDAGLLNQTDDDVILRAAGKVDYRDPALDSFVVNETFALADQNEGPPGIPYIGDRVWGVTSVHYNKEQIFVSTNDIPQNAIGPFSSDDSVGPDMIIPTSFHVIPRRDSIDDNLTIETTKGVGTIGVAVDGVPLFSNISKDTHYSGEVTSINIEDGGKAYLNPTVLFDPPGAEATATVIGGIISAINITSNANYTEVPTVTVTGGQGGEIALTFDNYGRITGASITNSGEYYNDPPRISIIDGSGRGRGALVTCTVAGGSLASVSVEVAGIDYNSTNTRASVIPVGAGAVVTATVQSWQYDRKVQTDNVPNASYDNNGAFLFEDNTSDKRTRYGYIKHPQQLLNDLGQTAAEHSPIVGWAWDGNPIYGPFGYANNKNADAGIEKQIGGYILEGNRTTLIPYTSDTVATLPPDTSTYPMGTFIQDWTYSPERVLGLGGAIASEEGENLHTENSDEIQYDAVQDLSNINSVLDPLNGKVCNTPEFPEDIYPDGVYCYFVSTFGEAARFPYIIGPTFKNLPSTQIVTAVSASGSVLGTDNIGGTYTDDKITVDLSELDLHRTGSLTSVENSIAIDIANVSEGSVSDIVIEDPGNSTNVVGDFLYFDNTDTNGQGASALITHIEGKETVDSSVSAIETVMISHRQLLYLGDTSDVYVLSERQRIQTSSKASFQVLSYDQEFQLLEVQTFTKNLVQPGDTFRDGRGTIVTIPDSRYGDISLSAEVIGGTSTFLSYSQPESRTAAPGDLWWSSGNNRLYILYKDADSTQWVTTNPIGMRPYDGALDTPTGSEDPTGGQVFASPQSDNRVTISTQAPSSRADGSFNQLGDLWWSTHTGNLYIWNSDSRTQGGFESSTGEWVVTDPSVPSGEGSSLEYEYGVGSSDTTEYEQQARVLISEAAPTVDSEGNALTPGILWWSPLTGKMYIYYTDTDTTQWVVTNPSGIIGGGEGSLNIIVPGNGAGGEDGSGGIPGDSVTILPELPTTTTLWVVDTSHFLVGDTVLLQSGAPGVPGVNEEVTIVSVGLHFLGVSGRNSNSIYLNNGTLIINLSRNLYNIVTAEPHGLKTADKVLFTKSTQEQLLNQEFGVVIAGVVTPATGTATIADGQVTGVILATGGSGYAGNSEVYFVGGGGVGAAGIATCSDAGELVSVTITSGGTNYTSAPTVSFSSNGSNTEFSFYETNGAVAESGLMYGTTSLNASGPVTAVKLSSGGGGYTKIPAIIGTYRRESDRASTIIKLDGTTIGEIEIVSGGRRYVNPTVIIEDTTNNGSGAEATASVINGSIVSITITNPGSGYVEPIVNFVEEDGKFIPLTKTIGAIRSFHVDRPGRNLTNDRTLNPEVELKVRLIVLPTAGSISEFRPNDFVYQGTEENKLATAFVVSYDNTRNLLELSLVEGEFYENEIIYNEIGTEANVLLSGQALAHIEVGGIAPSVGRFIDDTSKLSETYAVVQDSLQYQWFSYNISSPLQQVQYETFVRDLVHPTGFALFSDVLISDQVSTEITVFEADVDGGIVPL